MLTVGARDKPGQDRSERSRRHHSELCNAGGRNRRDRAGRQVADRQRWRRERAGDHPHQQRQRCADRHQRLHPDGRSSDQHDHRDQRRQHLNGVGTTSRRSTRSAATTPSTRMVATTWSTVARAQTLSMAVTATTRSGGIGIATANYVDNFETQTRATPTARIIGAPTGSGGDSGGVAGESTSMRATTIFLQFFGGGGGDFNGAQIQRSVDLAGATAATLSYSIDRTGCGR